MTDNIVLSYKAEVKVDTSWSSNAFRFATEAEALAYAQNLRSRWTAVKEIRVSPSVDPVNEKFENGRSIPVAAIYV